MDILCVQFVSNTVICMKLQYKHAVFFALPLSCFASIAAVPRHILPAQFCI